MNQVLIRCQPSLTQDLQSLGLEFNFSKQFGSEELDVIVPDVEYIDGNHPSKDGIWEDPDVQLCEHYGIDYDQVNCIEAL